MFMSLKVVLILANSVEPDEMPLYIASRSSQFAKVPIYLGTVDSEMFVWNLIFANIRQFIALQIQSSCLY